MSTKNRAVLSTEIVPEVLIKKKNYKEWSFRLRTYLKAQDVWDIIEPTSNGDVDDKVWEKKNATALHAIHICCGPDAFSLIEGIPEAKGAWDKLAESEPEREPELETEDRDISTDQVKRLYLAVREGDWCTTNWIITTYRDAVGARITYSRRTALHVAIMARKLSIVKLLVQNMSKEDLEKTDDDGFTALAIAIISNAELDIAECMVRKNTQILVTKVNEMLPAAMAFRYGHKEMGRYLYTMTPVDHLQQNREDGASIICNAIRMQSFDVALDLLHQHNELATTCESTILSRPPPVVALANLPSAFLSGCQLKFWQRWLYKC